MAWPTSVKVEFGIGVDPTVDYLVFDDADRGLFGTGTLAPEAGVWTDVSAAAPVLSISTRRGRQRLLEAYSRGTCTVVFDDTTGLLTPHNTASSYYPYVRPEIRMRVSVTHNGTQRWLFHGFVDSILPVFPRTDGGPRTVVIQATDAFKVLARFDPPAASSPSGAGELSGARINRILDLAGWPAGDRDVDAGLSTMQATTLAQNSLTELQLTADSEFGELYVNAEGKVTFRDRHARYEDSVSQTVQATFTDANTAGVLHYQSLDVPEYDAELVKNTVSIAAVGGEAQTASDATSQARYFDRSWNRHDLIHDGGNDASDAYADRVVFFSKDPEQRVDGIRLKGLSGSPNGLWAAMYGLDFGHRVHATRTLTGDDLSLDLYVEGIDHTISQQGEGYQFETTLRTSSAARVDAGMFIFDSATFGKLDTGTLAAY